MKKKLTAAKIFIAVFLPVWAIIVAANIIVPEESFSESENRYLAAFPDFTLTSLLNGSFMERTDSYIDDRFILRDEWITVQSLSEFLTGKREINGVLIGSNALFTAAVKDEGYMQKNIDGLRSFCESSGADCYFMLIPSASQIMPDKLPLFAQTADENGIIEAAYDKISCAKPVRVYTELLLQSDQYIFYRTDHHWTTYGAYLSYRELCAEMGIHPQKYTSEVVSRSFNGTLHSKSGIKFVESDTIEAFCDNYAESLTVFDGSSVTEYDSIYFPEYLEAKDKYSYFLGTNQPLVTLHGSCGSKKKLLVFKDSFSHCLAPMLLNEYDEIALIDMRYINTDIGELLDVNAYDDVLFMYSTDVFTNQLCTGKLINSK